MLIEENAGDGPGDIENYGKLAEVITLKYLGADHIVLFHCNSWDVLKRAKVDNFSFASVNHK